MKIIFLFITTLLLNGMVYAESYVLYNKDSKEILSIDSDDSAIIDVGLEKVVLEDDYIDLTYPDNFYKLDGDKIKLNSQRLEKEAKKETESRKRYEEEEKIRTRMRKLAIDQLKAEGEVFEYATEES